jgi:hypothetical protein
MVKSRFILAGLLLALAVAPALAQGPGGPGGGGGMSPQMQKFREQTKYKRQLGGQIRAIAEINRDPSTAVSPAQAKKLLAILKPWTSRDKMTEDQAKGLILQVKSVMTARQLTALGNYKPQRGGGFGGGGAGRPGGGGFGRPGGGPGGPGGPGGARRAFDPSRLAAMRDSNFLSTKIYPSNPFSQRRVESNQRMIAMLEARAHGAVAHAKR